MAPSPLNLPSTPGVITLSPEEKATGKWSRANLQSAMEYMHRDGLLVMDGIIDKDELSLLREDMLKSSAIIKNQKQSPAEFNHGIKSNFLQSPPLADEKLRFPDVYQNPFVIQVAEGYLGSDLQMPFITANVALANTTQKQPIHKDCSFVHPSAPFIAIANFLLSEFTPNNGSTEFWLGSHNSTLPQEQMWRTPESVVPTCDIYSDFLEERAKTRPPAQVDVPFGCVLLRDVRTWHAGMPNPSDTDRIMIAVAYQASWFPRDNRFLAPQSAKELLTGNPKVNPLATFVSDDEYLEKCQKWGPGEPMFLKYAPKTEGWTTISDIPAGRKIINKAYNEHANG